MEASPFTYEVALSFAGEQREYVSAVNDHLKARGVKTFYDFDHGVVLWGKNHTEELPRIFTEESRLVVMFVSEHYVDKQWPRHERRAILTEQTRRDGGYLLPVRFDATDVPGLDSAWHYLEASEFDPKRLADAICQQLVKMGAREPEISGFQIDLTNVQAGGEDLDPASLPGPLRALLPRPARGDVESVRQFVGYGTSQPVVIGPEAISALPDQISPEGLEGARLVLEAQGREAVVGRRLTLSTVGVEGQIERSFNAAITHGGSGTEGWSLESALHPGLHVTFCFPFVQGGAGEADIHLNVKGLDPASARQASKTFAAIRSASLLRLAIDGDPLAEIGQSLPADNIAVRDILALAEAAEDLMVIQERCGVHFPMPDQIEPLERLWLRTWRLLIEGKAAPIPRRSFKGVAHPDLADESLHDEGAFLLLLDGDGVTVADIPLAFPDYAIYHPNVRINGLRDSREDVRSGVERPREFEVETADGTPFVAYIPALVGPDVARTSPWALTDVDEPPTVVIPRGA